MLALFALVLCMAFHCNGSVPIFSLSLQCFSVSCIEQSAVLLNGHILNFLTPKLGDASVIEFRELFVLNFISSKCMASPLSCLKSG